jgi:voltage-gated potassium channel
MKTIQRRVWEIVESAKSGDRLSRLFDVFIIVLILLSTAAVVLESVDALEARFHLGFRVFEYACLSVFVVEYLARLWSCTTEPKFAHPVYGRLQFFSQPLTVIDLLAIGPSLMVVGLDLRFLRLFRIFRVLRMAALVRYSASLRLMTNVLKRCWRELAVTLFAVGILLIISSCLMYFAEHKAQPDVFPDIPSTMWWAVITITTVGYGDSYPITVPGKLLTAFIALVGVGVLAMPTAIIGGAFVEELTLTHSPRLCPHCGKTLD